MAESIRRAVAAGEPEEGFPAPSTSVGWAVFPDDGQDFETLMRSADDRMLRIKRNEPRPESSRSDVGRLARAPRCPAF